MKYQKIWHTVHRKSYDSGPNDLPKTKVDVSHEYSKDGATVTLHVFYRNTSNNQAYGMHVTLTPQQVAELTEDLYLSIQMAESNKRIAEKYPEEDGK